MRTRRSTELGLVFLAVALLVGILSLALPYVWDGLITRSTADTFLGQSVHLFWIPFISDAIITGMAALGLFGFVLLWAGRWELGAEYASRIGLAMLSMIVAAAALALWLATGILLGYFSGFSGLVPWRNLFAFVATVFLGFAFYWVLANLPLQGARPVAAVALALGVAGAAVAVLARVGLRRSETIGLEGAASALSFVSLAIWLGLCLWGSQRLRASRRGQAAVASTRSA